MRYSATVGGFFPDGWPGALPDDLVEITAEYHAQLMAAQNAGAEIRPDVNGVPQAVFPTPPTEAEILAAERAGMSLTRLQFALQALAAGVMTAVEAEGFVGPRTIPALGEAALALIEDAPLQAIARIRFAGAQTIERNDPFVPLLKAAAEWTDEQVDDFFRAGALL